MTSLDQHKRNILYFNNIMHIYVTIAQSLDTVCTIRTALVEHLSLIKQGMRPTEETSEEEDDAEREKEKKKTRKEKTVRRRLHGAKVKRMLETSRGLKLFIERSVFNKYA